MQDRNNDTLFGAVQMGYALIESQQLADWRRLLGQGLGLHQECADQATLAFRMDNHARRIVITRGPAEDFTAVGWQVRDEAALQAIVARLAGRGIAVEHGSAEEALLRGVNAFVRIKGPKGLPLELFIEPQTSEAPLKMLTSGFVTGASGMGHIALTSRLPEKMQRFWQEMFDARLSDRISQPMGGVMLDISFLRLNERHHSIAIAATRGLRLDPIRTQIQHMNLQAATLDDLSAAFERCRDLGYTMAHEIGQHPNDRELSFYVRTPSGFEIELGWAPLVVDEATWLPTSYNAISVWGHKPQKATALNNLQTNLGNFGRSLRKAVHAEYSPI